MSFGCNSYIMISVTYDNPASDATYLEGAWSGGDASGTFKTPIIYVDDVQDIDAGRKFKARQQQALDMEAELGG